MSAAEADITPENLVEKLVQLFKDDPELPKFPLPGKVRVSLGLPQDPEPSYTINKAVINKALFSPDADAYETRQCPTDIPIPDFNKLSEEYKSQYLVDGKPKIEVLEQIETITECVEAEEKSAAE